MSKCHIVGNHMSWLNYVLCSQKNHHDETVPITYVLIETKKRFFITHSYLGACLIRGPEITVLKARLL